MKIEDQIKRIQQIRDNENMTTCPQCSFIYLAVDPVYTFICPKCEEHKYDETVEKLTKPQMDWEYEEELLKLIEEKKAY